MAQREKESAHTLIWDQVQRGRGEWGLELVVCVWFRHFPCDSACSWPLPLLPFILILTHPLYSISILHTLTLSLSHSHHSFTMALHSVSSVPHVLRLSEPFPSLHNAHLLLDLVPFRRKPKRRTRKLRAFPSPSPLSHSAVKAVLHIDRTAADNSLQASPASSSSQPQVCFCFPVAFFYYFSGL